jgi:hypothetical protein
MVPFCGMNVAFVRELLPAVTQVPMNQATTSGYSLWRFDDLWCGGLLQPLINCCGDCLTTGPPIISHLRAGNLKRETAGEHFGHLISPYYYEMLLHIASQVCPGSYASMYLELCTRAHEWIVRHRERRRIPWLYADILLAIFRHLVRWAELFQ